MKHHHVVVWIDQREARIHSIGIQGSELEGVVKEPPQSAHVHHKAGPTAGDGKAEPPASYYHEVAEMLQPAGEILIAGPGVAKQRLQEHLRSHHPETAARVVAVEAADHLTDGQLIDFARRRFGPLDRMRPKD